MRFEKSQEYKDKEAEAKAIRKDILTARKLIEDAIARYKKQMLRARSKKQAEDLSVFDELKDYDNREQIRDAYGWDIITEAQMDRLMAMWDAREKYINEQGQFSDRVTDMLQRAIFNCGSAYLDTLEEFDAMEQRRNDDIKRIEQENAEFEYKRYIAGLKGGTA